MYYSLRHKNFIEFNPDLIPDDFKIWTGGTSPIETEGKHVEVMFNSKYPSVEKWNEAHLDWKWYEYYDYRTNCPTPDTTAIVAYKIIE